MQHRWFGIRLWMLALCATSLTVACGDSTVERASRSGKLQFALRGTAASGIEYRLRHGTFAITGAFTASVSTEDNLQAENISVELSPGEHSISLNPGWQLEAATPNGDFASVEASLTSANPQSFTIVEKKTTSVAFRFRVGDDTIVLGTGSVSISIEVDDSTASTGGAGGATGGSGGQATGGSESAGNAGESGATSTGGTASTCSGNIAVAVSAGLGRPCALLSTGAVQCWTRDSLPVAVSGIASATAIDVAPLHACVLLSTGLVQCWGDNSYGQLGNGSTDSRSSVVPVTVSTITNATAVGVGQGHACAVLSTGLVQCWGDNYYGQLGNGTTTNSSVPVTVSGISDATGVGVGESHTCALLDTGAVQCWGLNNYGQLGDGTTTNSSVPVTVSGITDTTFVDAGGAHTCAMLSTGSLQCWGANGAGQLGNGTTTNSSVPVLVSGINGANALSAGNGHTCAIVGGSVQCWGWNFFGSLGNRSRTDRSVPVAVVGIKDAVAVSANWFGGTCAALANGEVEFWGLYGHAIFADDPPDSLIPIPVAGFCSEGTSF